MEVIWVLGRSGPLIGLLVAMATFDCLPSTQANSLSVSISTEEAFDDTELVFFGRVLDVQPADAKGHIVEPAEAVSGLYRFEVLEEFKGTRQSQYEAIGDSPVPLPPLLEGRVYGSKPQPFKVGATYVVFAWGVPRMISLCQSEAATSRSALVKQLRKLAKNQ
jgi:hypothetical protein